MVRAPFTSGDPAADRRASFAETLLDDGDTAAAIEVLDGALGLAPGWVAGWFRLGEMFEAAGRTEDAARAWARCLELDPGDPFGAGLKRDLLRRSPVSEAVPPAFVELLFDQYATRFEASLVEKLGYRGPEILLHTLRASGFTHAGRAMDLGCGTGLMGAALRDRCDRLEGLDISAGMLAEARSKGIYDQLDKADISALEIGADRYDLIVAADVFIYLGALERIVGWCAGSLLPGGWLAFTVEKSDQPVELRESRRFAHSRGYVEDLLRDAGFSRLAIRDCVLRQDRGEDIASLCVVAAAPAPGRELEGDGEAEAFA